MMVNLRVLVIVALTEALFPRPAVATPSGGQWQGNVVGVADGDTITVMRNKTPVKVRLHGIVFPKT
jgi:endonuclease YncB( thermonuclease family)